MNFTTITLQASVDRFAEVERLRLGEVCDSRLRGLAPAGKGVNAARALRALTRGNVRAVAWVGPESRDFFIRRLTAERLQPVLAFRRNPTRECLTLYERASGREVHLREQTPPVGRAEAAAFLKLLRGLNLHDDLVAVCGSAPPGLPRAMLKRILSTLRRRSKLLITDTNGLFLAVASRCGIGGIKGNAREIGAWLKLDAPWSVARAAHRRALLARLASASPRRPPSAGGPPCAALVTLGAHGAILASGGQLWLARPPPLARRAIRSAVGCGDAATAGWLWALAQDASPAEAVRRAVACGTAKLLQADPGRLDARDVRRLLERTGVVRVPL